MDLIDKYIHYVRDVRRYSSRTGDSYEEILRAFSQYILRDTDNPSADDLLLALNPSEIRQYEVYMLDEKGNNPSTVNLHLSVLSGFCRFLMKEGLLKSNPVRLVHRPKVEKRLPEFFKQDAMEAYLERTEYYASKAALNVFKHEPLSEDSKELYENRLARLMISMFYGLGLRRSELIGLRICDVDFARKVVNVTGKGNKQRSIPMIDSLISEIQLYLEAVEALVECRRAVSEPLLVTYTGLALYPVYVDRAIKKQLGDSTAFSGRKSPHVLRHSVATGLLNEGAQLNSIKEMLGHSSLAATQVYTHNSIAKLQKVYKDAHPRAISAKK